MKKVLKVMLIVLAICLAVGVFTACSEPDGGTTPPDHVHNYATLKYDENNHWYECSCGEKSNVEAHKGGTATETDRAVCTICNQAYGTTLGHTHNYATLKYDENNHWYECSCGEKNNVEGHKGGTATETDRAVCTVCNQAYGTTLYVRDGDYIYFGSYPQTLKSESVTIDESTQTAEGYYFGSDGALYAKVVADPDGSNYTFSTGGSVVDGTTYYFKVEPIKWRILSESEGEALILCESILANKAYDAGYNNNYKESDIRAWLNAEFYNTAFTTLQQSLIKTTEVDNSASTTSSSTNQYACENTFDKVFLMSYQEMLNPDYGFSTSNDGDVARERQPTDYSRATGAWMNTSTSYYGNGYWWLRSPYSLDYYLASIVYYGGYVGYHNVYITDFGVVPALNIQLDYMPPAHTHAYTTLKYDENNHWYECSCGEKSNVEVHSGGTATEMDRAVCTVCGQAYGTTLEHTHNYATRKYDENNHWYECSCGEKENVEGHSGGTATETDRAVCTVCNQAYGSTLERVPEYTVTLNVNGGDALSQNTQKVTFDTEFTLPTPTREGCEFIGWYYGDIQITDETGEYLSNWNYTSDIELTAKWKIGGSTTYVIEGDYIYFGFYPQTLKSESVTIDESTQTSEGYYLGSDGALYAKVVSDPYAYGYTFSTGDNVIEGTTYYFKVEPIKWRILSESEGEALILCESILANKAYDTSGDNKYTASDIRAWLNAEFYNTAFTTLQQSLIKTTDDKVFLMSYQEMLKSDYGFSTSSSTYDTARRRQTTDYSRATGAYIDTSTSYYGNGGWWLRSSTVYSNYSASFVYYDGCVSNGDVSRTYYGVVPALNIQLDVAHEYIVTLNVNGGEPLSQNTQSVTYDTEFTLPIPTREGCDFGGWYYGNTQITNETGKSLSKWNYATDKELTAKWKIIEIEDSTTYVRDGDYIYFGSYPQTLKFESVTIDESAQTVDGYYLGSDGALYAKVVADPYGSGSSYTFSTGESVVRGTTYYFKVEPIKWRILSESKGEALILCESILANKAYAAGYNNYKNSAIRAWLNAEFYNTAFTTLQQSLIRTTKVDNSASTTGSSTNESACENTFDKVFLMSYQDMINPNYGFRTSYSTYETPRRRQTTDYSRATGVLMGTTSHYGNGVWWLRSPSAEYDYFHQYASGINYDGYFNGSVRVSRTDYGVVPALNIQLDYMPPAHTHNYATLKYDENNHWYECSCGEKNNVEVHSGGTAIEMGRAVCTVCGQAYGSILYIREGDYIYFGSYPQTLKSESVTIDESTRTSEGYYSGSDGALYAKVVADPFSSSYTFSTGDSVVEGTTYYFKVEPIKWRILSESEGEALILCESIIANKAYDSYNSNYANSDIRAWLNAKFYNTAFTTLQQSLIRTTKVDNSASTTHSSTNEYACENTFDKVFLMSYREVFNSDYGFSMSYYDIARRIQTTDYSRATGVWMSTSTSYYGNGVWWLRSPSADYDFYAYYVHDDGYVSSTPVSANSGVIPALNIQL